MTKKTEQEPGRIVFTREMKKTHTILIPMMLPIHFSLLKRILELDGYHVELLTTNHRNLIETGLKYTHNDTCYPAQLTIGQLIDATMSGQYDIEKIALLLMQTGGGCRASNYVSLLRKGLEKAGLSCIPVLSFNLTGLEKNPGFKMDKKILNKMVYAIMYGDVLMNLVNQITPYECTPGETQKILTSCTNRLKKIFTQGSGFTKKAYDFELSHILHSFAQIKRNDEKHVRVGIVGEIYVKFAPLGNNNLEAFLHSEGVEVVVPGLMDFLLYTIDAGIEDHRLYGTGLIKRLISQRFLDTILTLQDMAIDKYQTFPQFQPPASFRKTKALAKDVVHYGIKMGEGWLLTAEMLELIDQGVYNIVCTQPFGCLPNHIVGRGMMRKIKNLHPQANIVAIDYDASATKVNQENRLKLMLSTAKKQL